MMSAIPETVGGELPTDELIRRGLAVIGTKQQIPESTLKRGELEARINRDLIVVHEVASKYADLGLRVSVSEKIRASDASTFHRATYNIPGANLLIIEIDCDNAPQLPENRFRGISIEQIEEMLLPAINSILIQADSI